MRARHRMAGQPFAVAQGNGRQFMVFESEALVTRMLLDRHVTNSSAAVSAGWLGTGRSAQSPRASGRLPLIGRVQSRTFLKLRVFLEPATAGQTPKWMADR